MSLGRKQIVRRRLLVSLCVCGVAIAATGLATAPGEENSQEPPKGVAGKRVYENRLELIERPEPLLADNPEFVLPIRDGHRFKSPPLVDDAGADLEVRAWRYSYNARSYIEITNRLSLANTAVIVVHPWGLEDGQGWRMPQPAGFVFGSPEMLKSAGKQLRTAIAPFVNSLRGKAPLVMYSLPGKADPIRTQMYRSFDHRPGDEERRRGAAALDVLLKSFQYDDRAEIPRELTVSTETPVVDYFSQFPGGDPGDGYNGPGYWSLPIPVHKALDAQPDDVVIFDGEGYKPLREFLKRNGIRHVLLMGFATDMCVCSTTAGYENLRNDFNVFLVGDLTQATSQGNESPACNTTAALSFASLKVLITQVSWIKQIGKKRP